MEDNLNEGQPLWNTTSMENKLNERQTQLKTNSIENKWRITSIEDNFNGRQPQWKMKTLACLASQFRFELGPAQPQLVFYTIPPITLIKKHLL